MTNNAALATKELVGLAGGSLTAQRRMLPRPRVRAVRHSASTRCAASPAPPNVTLEEVLSQLATRSGPAALPDDAALPSSSSLPPFQSELELEAARGAYIAALSPTASDGSSLGAGSPPSRAPLPTPTRDTSSFAAVAAAPDYPSPPTPPPHFLGAGMHSPAAAAMGVGLAAAAAAGGGVGPATTMMAAGAPAASAATAFSSAATVNVAVTVVACVFGSALSAFFLACIPTLRAIRAAANEIAELAASVREEVPDTLAAVRISGMELTDCLEEVGELTADVGAGVKGTGKAVAMTVDTAGSLGKAAGESVRQTLPKVRAKAAPFVTKVLRETERTVEDALKENAETAEYSEPVVAAAARATKSGVRYARGALKAADVARKVGRVYKSVRGTSKGREREEKRDSSDKE